MSVWTDLGLTEPPTDSDGAPDAVDALAYALQYNRAFNVLNYGAAGDVAYQDALDAAEAAGGGVVVAPKAAYTFAGEVLIPSNVLIIDQGSTYTSTVAGEFAFFRNKNYGVTDFLEDRDENIYFFGTPRTRFRREVELDGEEGPLDGGIMFKGVDGCGVWDAHLAGGHTGVHFWGCTDIAGDRVRFYRVADCGLRIAWPETQSLGGCVSSDLGSFVAVETGKQLLSGDDVPEPVALGSSLIITQSDVTVRSFTHVDGVNAGNAFESGDGAKNIKIGRLECIVNTEDHKANVVLANYDGLHIGELILTMSADGECYIRSEGETDGSQIQKYLSIDSIVAWDRSGSTTNDLTALSIKCDTEKAHIGAIKAYGMRALYVHDTGAVNPTDITIDSIYVEGANADGVYIGPSDRVTVGSIKAYNCGQNTGLSNALRSGVIADSVADPLRIGEIVSVDTGANTQQYGLYSEAAVVLAGKSQLGGVTGQFHSGGSGTFIGDFDAAGTPESSVQASPGSTCRDRTNGKHYTKSTGSGNTGWVATGTQT